MTCSIKSAAHCLIALLLLAMAARGAEPAQQPPSSPSTVTTPAAAKAQATPPAGAPAPLSSNTADLILVKVDNTAITQGDLDTETKDIGQMMKNRGLSEQQFAAMLPTFKSHILDGLVTRALINNACADKKIAVTDEEVKKEIESITANLPKPHTLESILKQQGLTPSMFEDDVKDQLKLEKLMNISVTDPDVQNFYNENKSRYFETVRARHILIATAPTDDAGKKAAKKEKAENLRKQLVKGADFASLAKEHSDCPSKENGGELTPPFPRGQMAPAFEEAAFSLKTNEISSVVETDFGYHIIQVLEHKTSSLDEVKGRIAAMLKGKKMQQQAEPLIKSLKDKAKITYMSGATPPPEVVFPPVDASAPAAPAGKSAEKGADKQAERSTDKSGDKPADKAGTPAEKAVKKAGDKPKEK